MAGKAEGTHGRLWNPWRIGGWGLAALLLIVPLVAMQFAEGMDWTLFDFAFVAVLAAGVGLMLELTVWMSPSYAYRGGMLFALAASAVILVATGAVGMIGSEDDPLNLMFFGVIAIALLGAFLARFRAAGMAWAMAGAAAAHLVASAIGLLTDPRGGIVSALFAALWLISAALFREAAREQWAQAVQSKAS